MCRRSAASHGLDVAEFDIVTPEMLRTVQALRPRAIVDLTDYVTSLVPLALMSMGAVFVGRTTFKNRYEVLDGYNCLLVEPTLDDQVDRTVEDAFGDQAVFESIRRNGHLSAQHLTDIATERMLGALDDMVTAAY